MTLNPNIFVDAGMESWRVPSFLLRPLPFAAHHFSLAREVSQLSSAHLSFFLIRIIQNSINIMVKVYDLPQFAALTAAASQFKTDDKLHLRHLCGDAARCESLVATHTNETKGTKIVLDYSRQQVIGDTMETLFDLVDKCGLIERRDAMRCGQKINETGTFVFCFDYVCMYV